MENRQDLAPEKSSRALLKQGNPFHRNKLNGHVDHWKALRAFVFIATDRNVCVKLALGRVASGRQAHAVVPSVKDAVELREEDVSQDPQGALRRHDVHRLEAAQAQLFIPQHLLVGNKETQRRPTGAPERFAGRRDPSSPS